MWSIPRGIAPLRLDLPEHRYEPFHQLLHITPAPTSLRRVIREDYRPHPVEFPPRMLLAVERRAEVQPRAFGAHGDLHPYDPTVAKDDLEIWSGPVALLKPSMAYDIFDGPDHLERSLLVLS